VILTSRKDLISSYFFVLHPLSKGWPILPNSFLERESWSQPFQIFFLLLPQLDHAPKCSIRIWGWGYMKKGLTRSFFFFMQNFWNSKAIPDTEIILTSIQSELILKKFMWFLWRGFQMWCVATQFLTHVSKKFQKNPKIAKKNIENKKKIRFFNIFASFLAFSASSKKNLNFQRSFKRVQLFTRYF